MTGGAGFDTFTLVGNSSGTAANYLGGAHITDFTLERQRETLTCFVSRLTIHIAMMVAQHLVSVTKPLLMEPRQATQSLFRQLRLTAGAAATGATVMFENTTVAFATNIQQPLTQQSVPQQSVD